jgi:hypothetical protein
MVILAAMVGGMMVRHACYQGNRSGLMAALSDLGRSRQRTDAAVGFLIRRPLLIYMSRRMSLPGPAVNRLTGEEPHGIVNL